MTQAPVTLRRQLLLWLTIPLSIIWRLSTAVDYNVALKAANSAYDQTLLNKLNVLIKQIDVQDGHLVVKLPPEALAFLRSSDQDTVYYQVREGESDLISGYIDLPIPGNLTETPSYHDATFQDKNIRTISLRTLIKGHYTLVQIARTTQRRRDTIAEMLISMAIPQLLLILIAMLTVWYAIGRSLSPLLQIQNEISNRAFLDLHPVSQENVPLEIQPLIHGFNDLIARLGHLLTAQQRFVADAAHQLRTPLAGLKTQAELALRLKDPAEIQHSLQQIHTAANQANHLVQQLLVLARAEPDAQHKDQMLEFSLTALSKKITMNWISHALSKRIDLGFEGQETQDIIFGNPLLIGELLNNLIDNALRYTKQFGTVTVRTISTPTLIVLEVEDNGTGIPPEAQQFVFNRFFRILGSDQEGCGLGLAIVREIAHRHDTEVELLSGKDNTGTRMRIAFHRKLTTPNLSAEPQ